MSSSSVICEASVTAISWLCGVSEAVAIKTQEPAKVVARARNSNNRNTHVTTLSFGRETGFCHSTAFGPVRARACRNRDDAVASVLAWRSSSPRSGRPDHGIPSDGDLTAARNALTNDCIASSLASETAQ